MSSKNRRKNKRLKHKSHQTKNRQQNINTLSDKQNETDISSIDKVIVENINSDKKINDTTSIDTEISKQYDEEVLLQQSILKYERVLKMLKKTFPTRYRDIRGKVDFKINNCMDTDVSLSPDHLQLHLLFKDGNDLFVQLKQLGVAIWLNSKGDLCYRLSPDGEVITNSLSKASIVFTSLLHKNINIVRWHDKLFKDEDSYSLRVDNSKPQYIVTMFLKMVQKEAFNPAAREEFFLKNNLYYKNIYRPSKYRLNLDDYYQPSKNSLIIFFLCQLANEDEDRFHYIFNWIANLFINLKKSKSSLIFYSKDETCLNILFEQIIQPLFGVKFSVKINEEELASNFPSVLENKIIYNFNNITSYKIHNEKASSFSQKLLYSDEMFFKKNSNQVSEIETYGQTLITTTTPYIPLIDTNINNFSVFEVKNFDIEAFNKQIVQLGLLNSSLSESIENDLLNFAYMLRYYDIDTEKANKPYENNDDRDVIIDCNKDILELFMDALKNKDEIFFQKVQVDRKLFDNLVSDFKKDRVDRINLIDYFTLVFESTTYKSNRSLLKGFKENDATKSFFSDENVLSSSGRKFFKISQEISAYSVENNNVTLIN